MLLLLLGAQGLCACASSSAGTEPSPSTSDAGTDAGLDGRGDAAPDAAMLGGDDAGGFDALDAAADADAAPRTLDEAAWAATVWPVQVRVCSECHAGADAVELDLTRYSAWVANRDVLRDRVVVRQDMPPPGARMLTFVERDALARWLGP